MRLASLWTDHAVVQRNKAIVLWGWSEQPRIRIDAFFAGQHVAGATSWDGRFELRFKALPEGGPYDLKVTSSCGEEIVCKDILVGDVWLVSGQSNAEFPLMTFVPHDPLDQTKQYLDEGGIDPMLRCFTTIDDALASPCDIAAPGPVWQLSDEDTAPSFTAIGAWFALFLRKKFPNLPVGIIHSSWGGTTVLAWMSRSALMQTEAGRKHIAIADNLVNTPESWNSTTFPVTTIERPGELSPEMFAKVTRMDTGNTGFAKGFAAPDLDDSDWKNMAIPGSWLAQGISQYGAVWFRRSVDLPASWEGKALEIHTGGIDKHDVTYFNGVQVGATGKEFETWHWNVYRNYPIPGDLVKAGKNTVAIRAYCFYYDGGFCGRPADYYLLNTESGEKIPLADVFWKAFPEYSFEVAPRDNYYVNPIADPNTVNRLFDNKIRPLIPYGIKGVLWYQGESDTNTPDRCFRYLDRFTRMIQDWRYLWAQGDDFPFYFVQLANYDTQLADRWLKIQNDQRIASLTIKNTACITGSDLALFEPNDIHPHDKRSFGYRLFLAALAKTYGDKDTTPQGPTLDRVTQSFKELRLHFIYADGLHAKDGGDLKGFEIAEADGKFAAANARIEGDEIILTANCVPYPVAARYNANVALPEGNLVNSAGLPALSFTEKAPEA